MQRSADEKSIHTHIAAKKVRKKHTPTKLICFADTRTTNKRNSKCVTFIIQIFDLTLPQATIKWNISNFGGKIIQKAAATITTCTSYYSTNAFSAIECHSVERVWMRCLRSHQYVLAHNTNLYISFAACILEKFAAASIRLQKARLFNSDYKFLNGTHNNILSIHTENRARVYAG